MIGVDQSADPRQWLPDQGLPVGIVVETDFHELLRIVHLCLVGSVQRLNEWSTASLKGNGEIISPRCISQSHSLAAPEHQGEVALTGVKLTLIQEVGAVKSAYRVAQALT